MTDYQKYSGHLRSEKDRACAIIGAAVLDAKLEELFRRKLLVDFHNELLGQTRLLSSFGARISVARALNWVHPDAGHDLHCIRKIRNDFAHKFELQLSFESQKIADKCRNLRTPQVFLDCYDPERMPKWGTSFVSNIKDRFSPPRERFLLAFDFLFQHLDQLDGGAPEYHGPELLDEIRALARTIRIF